MADNGIFVGNTVAELNSFESWLGNEVDTVRLAGSRANWSEHANSVGWLAGVWENVARDKHWTIPLLVDGATLANGAKGAYNSYYLATARKLIAESEPGTGPIIIRTGEEFNGGWFPWAAAGKEADFIKTYQNFVNVFRSVSSRFDFEWNVNIGNLGMDPAKAYPGDAYVDIIGMDFYYNTQWDNPDPLKAWDFNVTRQYGLQWLENFADAHNKPTAYSEWGVMSNSAGPYIQKANAWFDSHDVVMEAYWNSNADFPGKLSDNSKPSAGAAYKAAFADDDASGGGSGGGGGSVVTRPSAPAASGAHANWMGGTSGNDTMNGDSRNNSIDGMAGSDRMAGGAGDDRYKVERSGDVTVENSGAGIDTVTTYASSTTLAANVEHLQLDATYTQTGTGNGLANRIASNGASDTLNGLGGNDWLTGGGGNDTFVLGRSGGDDVVTDFSAGDRINLSAFDLTYTQVRSEMVQSGSDVVIEMSDGSSIMLFNTTIASLGSSAFLL